MQVLGIDFGTSGARACLLNEHAQVLAWARSNYVSDSRQAQSHEQAPEDWWQALGDLCRQLPIDPNTPLALAIDGTSGSLLPCDAELNPTGMALMYDDARAEADEMGSPPADGLSKALWLTRHGAELIVNQTQWLCSRLCDSLQPSDENNALKMGFDPQTQQWDARIAKHQLPLASINPVSAGTHLGPLSTARAQSLGLPIESYLVAGTTDSIAAFLATGASQLGDAVTSLGSTLVVKLLTDQPITDAATGVYSHRLGQHWLVGGASNSGGAVLRQHFSDERMRALEPQLHPDQPTGLSYYPLPQPGERFPFPNAHKTPLMTPRPEDDSVFFQALLEGIADIEASAYALLQQLSGIYPQRLFSVGGGAHNAGWTAIRQNRLQCPLITPRQHEAAYGAALLALRTAHDSFPYLGR